MKKIHILAAVLLCMALLFSGCGGNVRGAERVIGDSELYSPGEIRMAMEKAVALFDRNFDGCTLTEIVYDEAFSRARSEGWAEQYGADEAIVLYSSFRTGSQTQSLEPNSSYEKYQWILTRNRGSGWVLRTWGYG